MKVFFGSDWTSLEDKAVEIWMSSGKERPTLIVPTTAMQQRLLMRLSQRTGGILGEHTIVLDRLAEDLAFGDSPRDSWATVADQWLATYQALTDLNIDQGWRTPGMIRQINKTIEEIEMAGLDPDTVRSVLNDKMSEHLCSVWVRYREILNDRGLYTTSQMFQRASEALDSEPLPICLRPLLIYGFRFLAKLQWEFVRKLVSKVQGNGKSVSFFFFYPKFNTSAVPDARRLVALVTSQWQPNEETVRSSVYGAIKHLLANIFQWNENSSEQEGSSGTFADSQGHQQIFFLECAGEYQEVETAVRYVKKLVQSGLIESFQDALLFVPGHDTYLPALEWVSSRFSLPLNILTPETRSSNPLEKTLWAIASARRNGWDSESVIALLFDPHIRIKNGCRPLVDPDRRTKIMDLIRKGIFRYEAENWIRYLDLTEEAAHFLREVSSLPIQAPVSKHAEAWIRLIDKWLAHRGRKEDIVEGLLSYLTLLRDWNCDISIEYFLEIITSLVRERKKDMVPGVRVADAEAGRGLSAPAVIILGLHDGFFPPSQPTFQLLTDAQREKLEDRTEFPLAHSKVRHKESFCSLFSELIGAATAVLVLSRCHSDADGRERSPSLFYTAAQEVLRNICGVNPPIQKQTGDVIPDDDEILSSRELKIASVYKCFNRWETTKPVAGISILRSPYFRMRLKDEYKRYTQPKGGTWDGRGMKISDRLPLETWRTKGLRVTALEDYKSCPFRFFAEHILGLKPVREAVTPTPEQRGTLWHGVLTKFLKEFIVTGQLPSQERLKEIAIEELDGLRDQIPKPFFEALEKEVILLCGKIHSAEQREAMEWVPLKVEEDIKLKASEWGGEGFLTDLIVIMRPDRVDKARADPEKLRVVDYKTGGAPGPKEVREGLHLVLPLSSGVLGAQEFVFLRALEYTTEGKYGASCRAPSQNLPKIDEAFRIAKDYVLTALQEMSEGHFTVDPYDSSACQMCGRQAFCRKGSMRITYRS